jgi:hypothetical protein
MGTLSLIRSMIQAAAWKASWRCAPEAATTTAASIRGTSPRRWWTMHWTRPNFAMASSRSRASSASAMGTKAS